MDRLEHKSLNKTLRKQRVRAKITESAERPRLSIKITNRHIVAQIIDDTKSTTLASVTTVGQKNAGGSMSERAAWVGEQIANKAKTAKISQVVLDRGDHLYHGRIKVLADAARDKGLEF
ncbi:MAG TPA: 50S ribosomal protein L18 [Candidatus Saccharimonadales bacterium]|nr:50S ribosomal protein L18 [Candidatus Saccharimonadales bacterium]